MSHKHRYPSPGRIALKPYEAPDCQVYAIELDETVLLDPDFAKANPRYRAGQPLLYIGLTSLTPQERFLQHVHQLKNCSRIAAFGRRLRMDLVPPCRPVRRSWALQRERRLARTLRAEGFGVWQA